MKKFEPDGKYLVITMNGEEAVFCCDLAVTHKTKKIVYIVRIHFLKGSNVPLFPIEGG